MKWTEKLNDVSASNLLERHSSGSGLDVNTLTSLIAETDEVLAYADLLYNWDSKGELQTPKFEASTRAADAVEFLVLRGTDKKRIARVIADSLCAFTNQHCGRRDSWPCSELH